MGDLCLVLISTNFIFLLFTISVAIDSISPLQSISDGTTLVSSGGSFELGFFSPGSSANRYLGIWYKNIPDRTVVWVANRCNPINDSSGMLTISSTGNLVLMGQNKSVVWSTSSVKNAQTAMLQLLDSGNLVLRDVKDRNSGSYLWQSFDYPSDTLLPGMKLGWDLRTGLKRRISAWKSSEDPCQGDFSYGIEMEHQAYPQAYIRNGSAKFYRGSPLNGLTFCGSSEKHPSRYSFNFVYNDNEVYYMYNPTITYIISRIVLNQTTSSCARFHWKKKNQYWTAHSSRPKDLCDHFGVCGANANCIIGENPVCECLNGFKPKSQEKWDLTDWSLGCERNKTLSCQKGYKDVFVKFPGLKLPDTTHSWVNKTMNLKECRTKCLNNCSCMAYTSSDIGAGTGCIIWSGDLIDTTQVSVGGQEMYVRMSASELENDGKVMIARIVASVIAVVLSGALLVSCYTHGIRKLKEITDRNQANKEAPEGNLELPLFDLTTLVSATDHFSNDKKLGEGGFGPVYKGTLADGQEIAVKRLSRSSGQGLNEFMNEVILIVKLQHRNLVKLLGCCVQGEEKMLIYEYMPRGSLDSVIFDKTRGKLLLFDWPKSFNIICGIARGLLYLHQDSRLRIIHRDLKASNVLLDKELNPKISDFGLARTLTGGDQTEGISTNRVVGTFGYMAPEYVIEGLFSVKSDVFSFGVLVLEVISGRKNKGFCHPTSPNLIGHAWRLWNEGRHVELIDACLRSSCTLSEVFRCIHVSLLCVQHNAEDRPSMASVVLMLGSEIALPQPKLPGFFREKESHATGSYSRNESSSTNELSISILEAR